MMMILFAYLFVSVAGMQSTLIRCLSGLSPIAISNGSSILAVRNEKVSMSGRIHVAKPASIIFQNPDHQVVMPTVLADVAFAMAMSQSRDMLHGSSMSVDERRKIAMKALRDVGMADFAEVQYDYYLLLS